MDYVTMIGQGVGILAMLASVVSFQMRTHRSIMLVQILTAILFSVHFGLLGGETACVLNAVAVVRNVIFLFQNDSRFCSWRGWTVIFSGVMVLFGALSWEGWVSIFFVVSMIFNTISLSMSNPQSVRRVILISSPLSLIYNILTLSIGGIINEVLAECSAIVGLIRYRNTDKQKE